jgi:hypothetical protein
VIAVEPTPVVASPQERTPRDVLRAAARYIEEHGWYQGNYRNTDGRVCIVGAILSVTPEVDDTGDPGRLRSRSVDVLVLAFDDKAVTRWNDAPGRTEAEVLVALRAAAESYR